MSKPRVRRGYKPVDSEAAFLDRVTQLAGYGGWLVYHTHRSDRSQPGFPDLVMVRSPRLIFAELKAANAGRRATVAAVAARPEWLRMPDVSDAQAAWLMALANAAHVIRAACERDLEAWEKDAGVEVYVWRPDDWPEIESRLARLL